MVRQDIVGVFFKRMFDTGKIMKYFIKNLKANLGYETKLVRSDN